MTEMYTMMRYLQYDQLQKLDLEHFDAWASTFGNIETQPELAPEGTGYRVRTRFATFNNLPELMTLFKEVADIKTSDSLNLDVPEAIFEVVQAEPSKIQQEMIEGLSERAAKIQRKEVSADEDNMLVVTSDGRKIGLDQRLINPDLPDDPNSKVNLCVNDVANIWEETKQDKLTQLVFCDFSTPAKGKFNVYDDMRAKLISKGIPEHEIAFIHDYKTDKQKKQLFSQVRSGKVRVLIGSTSKMGAGTNVQDKLIAVHHLDAPWRPRDLIQRNGRIIRQGNKNKQVRVKTYVTRGTFDAYLFQMLEKKQRFISQIMTSKTPVRSMDDIDDQVLTYAEIKALSAGNPDIVEKMNLDVDVQKLKIARAFHQSQQYKLEDDLLKHLPSKIAQTEQNIVAYEKDKHTVDASTQVPDMGISPMLIKGYTYTERTLAGDALKDACKQLGPDKTESIGMYRGLELNLFYDKFTAQFGVSLKGDKKHTVMLEKGFSETGAITRIDNALANIDTHIIQEKRTLDELQKQVAIAQQELGKPYPKEDEYQQKLARLQELDMKLRLSEKEQQGGVEQAQEDVAGNDEPSWGTDPAPVVEIRKKASHER